MEVTIKDVFITTVKGGNSIILDVTSSVWVI